MIAASPRLRAARSGAPLLLLLSVGCGGATERYDVGAPEVAAAMEAIHADAIERHMRVLADDSLQGRAPGTPGFEGASRYVEATLRGLGLEPAGDDGTYRQAVPLQESMVVMAESSMSIDGRNLVYGIDFYLSPDPLRERTEIEDAAVVFVGFGVSAPALGYDDYMGIDVDGKVVAYLSGGPPSFPSNERAYYSSGATKQAEAIDRGAIGTITFWDPDDPRFRWDVNAARSQRGSFAWLDADGAPSRADTELRGSASLNTAATRALFRGAPRPLDDVIDAAARSTPQSFELSARVSIETASTHRRVQSHNVVAKLEGSDPALRDEHVVYVGHVDHFGVGVAVDGDSIYNGAHDNASGTSIVLEIARAYTSLPTPPRRSILFLVVTAEEWGLLGSDYFVQNPTVPRSSLVANFSLDMPFLFHRLLDIVPYGAQHSSLGRSVATAAGHLGIDIGEDPIPEQVLFIRSDHFSFIRQGIPALFIKSGFETGDPALDGAAINAGFRSDIYHTPFDEIDQGFDFEAGAQHARLNFLTGLVVAEDDARPTWNEGDFFGGLFGGR